jgi:hypothetical protein
LADGTGGKSKRTARLLRAPREFVPLSRCVAAVTLKDQCCRGELSDVCDSIEMPGEIGVPLNTNVTTISEFRRTLARATAGLGFAVAAVGVFGLTAGAAAAEPSSPVPMDDPVPAPGMPNPAAAVDVANALLAPLNSLLGSFMPGGSSLIPGLSGAGGALSPAPPGQAPGLPGYPGGAVPGQFPGQPGYPGGAVPGQFPGQPGYPNGAAPGQVPGQYPGQPGYPNGAAPGQVPGQYPGQPGYPNGAAPGQVPGQYPAQSGYANGVAPGSAATPGGVTPAHSQPRSPGQRPPVV